LGVAAQKVNQNLPNSGAAEIPSQWQERHYFESTPPLRNKRKGKGLEALGHSSLCQNLKEFFRFNERTTRGFREFIICYQNSCGRC